eukprot:4716272-Pyramimonas_sp.AAC.1
MHVQQHESLNSTRDARTQDEELVRATGYNKCLPVVSHSLCESCFLLATRSHNVSADASFLPDPHRVIRFSVRSTPGVLLRLLPPRGY